LNEAKTFTVALFNMEREKDVASTEELVEMVTVASFPAGASTAVKFTWTPAEAGKIPTTGGGEHG